MKIAFKNSKILMINGRTLTPVPGQGPEPGLHYVYTSSDGHGSISASPMSGKKDTLITLSNTPDQNYIFSKYTLNNVDLAGSSFLMPDEDAYVRGYFQPDVRTITVTQPSHGTITAPASAQIGSTVTLSCTADTGYVLQYFTVNGSQIQGNTFVMPASNVTVSASIAETDYVQIGTQKWSKSFLEYTDGGEGITVKNGIYHYNNAAMLRIASSIPGWHIPTRAEVNTLLNYVGNDATSRFNALASTTGWTYGGGTNSSGFNAKPNSDGKAMYCWTTTRDTGSWWYYFYLHHEILYETDYYHAEVKSITMSQIGSCPIRLIKDS